MSKPSTFPTFAVDAVYTGGAEAGTPTKVAWTSGRKQEGLEPGSHQLCAQNLNEHFNNIGEWTKYLGLRVGRVTDLSTNWHFLRRPGIGPNIPGSAAKFDGDPIDTGAPTYVNGAWTMGTSTKVLYYPVVVPAGTVITGWTLYVRKTSTSGTITAQLFRRSGATGVETAIAGTGINSNNANNPGFITLNHVLTAPQDTALFTGNEYYIKFTPSGTTGDFVYSCQVAAYSGDQTYSVWQSTASGTGSVTGTVISTIIGGGAAAVLDLPANADFAGVRTIAEYKLIPCHATTVHVMEFEIDTTELVGTPGLTFIAGIVPGDATGDCVSIEKTSASANYFLRTTKGSVPTTTVVPTGVAAAAAVTRFTLLWFGASVDSGGQRAELYINGTLVATSTTNMPDGVTGQVQPGIYITSTGATTSTFHLSPVRLLSVRYLFGD